MQRLRLFLITAFVTFFVTSGWTQHREVRTWRNESGREIEASLVSSNGKDVVLRLKNGRMAEVGLNQLSPEDREYVAELEKLGIAQAVSPMPEETSIDVQVEVQKVGDSFETTHFRFTADRDLSVAFIAEAARIFEATLHAIDSLPFGLNPTPPEGLDKFEAYFVGDKEFEGILRQLEDAKEAESVSPPMVRVAGVYIPQQKRIVVPFQSIGAFERGSQMTLRKSSDTSTLIHEITHQVIHDWLTIVPLWFTEGLSEYMAAVPYQNGRFEFRNIDRGISDRLGSKYRGIDQSVQLPKGLLPQYDAHTWGGDMDDYREALILFYHLVHHEGEFPGEKITAFLHVLNHSQTKSLRYIEDYNRAAGKFEKERLAFNQRVSEYNDEVERIRRLIDNYNEQVAAYNNRERDDPPQKPSYIDPVPPEKLELPEILAEAKEEQNAVDIVKIANEQGREAILAGRTLQGFANEMAEDFSDSELEIVVSTEVPD